MEMRTDEGILRGPWRIRSRQCLHQRRQREDSGGGCLLSGLMTMAWHRIVCHEYLWGTC